MPHSRSSFEPTFITIHDAVTDSPVYRANTKHFDEQLIHLEKWLNSFLRHLKRYNDLLEQLNAESAILCKRAVPGGLDEVMIGNTMSAVQLAQINLTGYRSQYYWCCHEKFLRSPANEFNVEIQIGNTPRMSSQNPYIALKYERHLTSKQIHFRKEHQTTFEQYEAQLETYAQGTTKENAALQEEATQLYKSREAYVRMSGQHVMRILNLRSLLEHNLVETFSAASTAHTNAVEDAQTWQSLDVSMNAWRKRIIDDKHTCKYQLSKQETACKKLAEEYLELIQPGRPLQVNDTKDKRSRWGYLFVQTGPSEWARKWFFLHNGYFGALKQLSSSKIAAEDRVAVALCNIRSTPNADRRYCFEVSSSERTYTLQAETEQDMQEWISTFEKNQRSSQDTQMSPTNNRPQSENSRRSVTSIMSSDSSWPRSPVIVSAKAKSTTVVSTPTDIPVTLSMKMPSMSPFSNLSSLSGIIASSTASLITSINSSGVSSVSGSLSSHLTIVLVSTSPEPEKIKLSESTSLTPLLVCEASKSGTQLLDSALAPTTTNISRHRAPSAVSPASWGLPLTFVPDAFENIESTNASSIASSTDRIVWPLRPVEANFFDAGISEYHLESKNIELRRLFGGVIPSEVVLDAFSGSLRKRAEDEEKPVFSLGYGYPGQVFVTQHTFWFYSCVLISCINSVAIRLKDIKEVRLIADPEEPEASKRLLALELPESEIKGPLIFNTLLDDVELVAQRLQALVNNAKAAEPISMQNLYHRIHNLPNLTGPALSSTQRLTSSPIPITPASTPKSQESRMPLSIATDASVGPTVTPPKGEPWRPQSRSATPENKIVTPSIPRPADPDDPPAHLRVPKGACACECDDHLDRLEVEIDLPVAAKRLYEIMFSDEETEPASDGGVWKAKTEAIAGHDLKMTKWQTENETTQRTLSYFMPVSNPIVRMKEAEVVETQVLLKKQDYIRYVVQISTKTAALPYADAFIPSVRYCITRVDRSHCKLAIHIGVLWVKSVMVKSIITKAALRGMADSINVFTPILEEAAQKVANDVEKERKQLLREWRENCGLDEGAVSIEEESDDSEINVEDITESSQPDEMEPDFTDDEEITDKEKTLSLTSTVVRKSSFLRIPAIISSKRPSAQAVKRYVTKDSLVSEWSTKKPFYIMLCVVSILILLATYLGKNPIGGSIATGCVTVRPVVNARAVYLRDLQEGVLKKKLQPPYAGSKSFQLFLQTVSASNTTAEQQHNWYNMKHYKLATDLDISRERVAMLRHEMLTIFQLLNKVDGQLLENEYMNWLLDNRLKCSEQDNAICDEVNEQLYTFF
ncbi:SNF1-interacting protein [Apophysomyces ossiformis]|uniref:SNF1-interacting protein n=1 Tax=Apophysomyces ossiformis TaxID=679940 RepID=A0A8H7EMW6_9FUNG|nr:SNF1-interacting protein [Apophysomyces ossiformis]